MKDTILNEDTEMENLQLYIEDVNLKFGLKLKIDKRKSAIENQEDITNKCDEFWDSINKDADDFISALEEVIKLNSPHHKIQEDKFPYPENIESFLKLKLHPFAMINIALNMKRTTLKNAKSIFAKQAADAKARKLQILEDNIKKHWATGMYLDRNICAEKNWKDLKFKTEGTARKKLKNTPDPHPWPAKENADRQKLKKKNRIHDQ